MIARVRRVLIAYIADAIAVGVGLIGICLPGAVVVVVRPAIGVLVRAGRRSATRAEAEAPGLSAASAVELAERLLAPADSPSAALQRQEMAYRVRAALDALPEPDREVLVLRYLEQLSAREVGAVLGISEAAAKKRALRALQRLHASLKDEAPEERP